MVLCVKVPAKDAEDTRKILSKKNLVNKKYKITSDSGFVYIPIVDDTQRFETVEFDAPHRDNNKSLEDILGYKPTYEWLGNIVILKEDSDIDEILDAFQESSHNPKSIVNKKTRVKGEVRVPEYDLVWGEDTETLYKEYGYRYKMDVTSVYFTPRLSTERKRFMDDVEPDDRTFDMFAGVGPYAIPAADIGESAVGVDINEDAVRYMEVNSQLNDVEDSLSCINSDVRDVAEDYRNWSDRIVMNLPHTADQFLDVVEVIASEDCRVYMYDFVSDSKSVDEVAEKVSGELLGDVEILNYDMRKVRPYAPGISNVCFEFNIRLND